MRVALNPLQWYATPDGGLDHTGGPPLDLVLSEVAEAGFDAVHAEVPAGETAERYRARLARHGLRPAPGYFSVPVADAEDGSGDLLERAGQVARLHAELGLGEIFVAADLSPARFAAPARSAGRPVDRDLLSRAARTFEEVGAAMTEHGVRACLHGHVGTPVESLEEVEFVLEATDPELVGFGPDVGHLAWAGADPVPVLERHRDRTGAVHLKDVRLDVAERGREHGWGYLECVRAGIWAEPGRGNVDLDGVLGALAGFSGWLVVEVDRPTGPSLLESTRACFEWVSNNVMVGG